MKIELGQHAYLLFDGDCGLCSWAAEWVQKLDRHRLFVVQPYQSYDEAELRHLGITYQQCAQKVHVITRRGQVYRGAFGVNYFFWHYWPWKLLIGLMYAVPPLLLVELLVYAWVARHRHRLSQWFGLKACLLKH
jgi:predicted DCC family thiol-disulfide oxidoreductase YuxK